MTMVVLAIVLLALVAVGVLLAVGAIVAVIRDCFRIRR